MAELHRPRNNRLGQVSPHSHMMLVTLQVLPHRCSAVETPSRGHLTHQYGSCKFSRNCPAGKMGTLQEGNPPRTVSAGFQADCFKIRKGIARRAPWVLPPTPFMWARNPIPPPEPSSRPSVRPPRTSTK